VVRHSAIPGTVLVVVGEDVEVELPLLPLLVLVVVESVVVVDEELELPQAARPRAIRPSANSGAMLARRNG
jgi:hypothetical protein